MALSLKANSKRTSGRSSSNSDAAEVKKINYDQILRLNQLCASSSLSPEEKHQLVMKQYSKLVENVDSKSIPFESHTTQKSIAYAESVKSKSDASTVGDDALSTSAESKATTNDDRSVNPRRYRLKRDCYHYEEGQEREESQKQHDIGFYIRKLHNETVESDGPRNVKEAINILLEKAYKMPFERSAEENAAILKALRKFDFLTTELNDTLLRELSVFAFIEEWHEGEVTVFGNTGLHIILTGSVMPQSLPCLRRVAQSDEEFLTEWCTENNLPVVALKFSGLHAIDEAGSVHSGSAASRVHNEPELRTESRVSNPYLLKSNIRALKPGDVFGTLKRVNTQHPLAVRISDKYPNQLLNGLTIEDQKPDGSGKQLGCRLLKLNASDYERIVNQIAEKTADEKVRLLSLKEEYKLFPKQVLAKVTSLIEWLKFPEQSVLAQEGVRAPYIAFLKEGSCNVFRQTVARKNLPLGKAINKKVQVLIGRIEAGSCSSIGDASFFENKPMNCTVISDTPVVLGVIELDKLESLDDTTIQLLTQSSKNLFEEITDEQVQKMYVDQAVKDEWAMAKHAIVMEVINARGIRPGYGKWS